MLLIGNIERGKKKEKGAIVGRMMEGVSVEAIQEGSERREGGQTVAARQDPVVRGGEDMCQA